MNKKTSRQENAVKTSSSSLRVVLKSVVRAVKHNWPLKLLALVLSILLWAGLIMQDPALKRERVFPEAQVSIIGMETIKNYGYVVMTDLTTQPLNVRLKVDVPQMEYNNVTAANYNPRIELGRIREAGEMQIKITANSSSNYGDVVEITPDSVDIYVEEYISRFRVPIAYTLSNRYPEGFYCDKLTVSPGSITVSGPRSLVERVRRAYVDFDCSIIPAAEGHYITSIPFELLDEKEEKIDDSLIIITSESIRLDSLTFEFEMYPSLTLPLGDIGLVKGEPAEGYEVKGINIYPNTIVAAAPQVYLDEDSLLMLFLEKQIDLSGLTESTHQIIRVQKPPELKNITPESVNVTIEIGPKIISRVFESVTITASDIPANMVCALSQKKADVTLTGPQLSISKLKASALKLNCSLLGLEEGIHTVPIEGFCQGLEDVDYSLSFNPTVVEISLTRK